MADIKTGIFAKNVQKRLNRAQEKVRAGGGRRGRWRGRGGEGRAGCGSGRGRAGAGGAGTPCPAPRRLRRGGRGRGGGSAGARGPPESPRALALRTAGRSPRTPRSPGRVRARARAVAGAAARRLPAPEPSASPCPRRPLPPGPQVREIAAAVLPPGGFPGDLSAAETTGVAQKLLSKPGGIDRAHHGKPMALI